ncbi:MAG: hypothetical protein IJ904_03695 [Candidatus Methanomethylophilaceae archaeon]|nr:hypothetical protein [Candidatus Methanomethylophilaceae archaeon]MBR6881737.1 hypothetical protein [Bacteroidales bacterium]
MKRYAAPRVLSVCFIEKAPLTRKPEDIPVVFKMAPRVSLHDPFHDRKDELARTFSFKRKGFRKSQR